MTGTSFEYRDPVKQYGVLEIDENYENTDN